MQRAPDISARGKGVAIEALADRIAQARTAQPPPPPDDEATLPGPEARQRPEPPPPPQPPFPEPPPAAARHEAVPPTRADAGTIPRPVQPDVEAEWLAARLREGETPAWSSMWKRRLVTWSIACGLLAGLAAGGLWLYEENRVEDALVVVANTSPAGQPPAAQAFAAGSPAPAPAPPAAVPDAVKPVPEAVKPVPEPEPVAPAVEDKAPVPVEVTPPRRTPRARTALKKRTAEKVRRVPVPEAPAAANPSPRQRREETLMQCRAHGYDARQCIERACTMTRYGLACKG